MDAGETAAEPERIAGRYAIESELARGGMAIIYRVLDESTQQKLALKRLRPELADRANIAMLFQREYHTLAQISHPRIIEVHEYGLESTGPYYTMELLDGQDLRELAPLPWREAAGYLRDVASSLALLHTRRLLHRDLSPRNVRRTSDGRAKLLDFGTMATFGVPHDIVGTAPFVPPEALSGVAIDHRADLYSLGALAYWLLTRKYAFRAKRIEDLQEAWRQPPAPPSQYCEVMPKELEDLVLSMLQMDPGARPGSAADVIERLTALAGLGNEELVQTADSYLLSSALVGRDRELKRLMRRLERTAAGRGSAVVIEANPGVGRTRLLNELSLKGQLAGALVVSVTAEPGRGAYALARGIMRGLFRNAPSDTRHAAAPYAPVLGHLLSELRASQSELAVLPADPAELRVRQQNALLAVILEMSRERPLLLLVDDFHRADEASAALLAALAQYTPTHPMMIACSVKLGSVVVAPDAVRAFRSVARSIRIHRLRRADTQALAESLFGDVPNADRLATWIHDITKGNPTQVLELARHLVDTRTVVYADGLWVLPLSVSQRAVPGSLGQIIAARLGMLSAEARSLACALCVRETPVSLALIAAVAPRGLDDLFELLGELVRKGVLESAGAGDGYAFLHDALRGMLLDQLSPEERMGAHLRMGEALVAGSDDRPLNRVEGAWHLMRGGRGEYGAMLVAGAIRSVDVAIDVRTVPAVEEAVRILEAGGAPNRTTLAMRTMLVAAGYDHERRLAYEYGPLTVEVLFERSGLALASRCAPLLGRKLSLYLGLFVVSIRGWFQSRERRLSAARAINYFLRAVANHFGAMTVGVDVEGVERAYPLVQPLAGFPERHPCHIVFLFCKALHLLMQGRESEHRELCRHVVALLDDPAAVVGMTPEYRRDLQVGVMMTLGIAEGYSATGKGLQQAERIEALGTYFSQVAAHRVRFIYHLMRGESELAEPHRRRVELHAVQGGTTWQVELWSLALEGLAALLSEDHIRHKQLTQSLSRMVGEVPSLRIYHELMQARVERRVGSPEVALSTLERLAARMPPKAYMGWDVARLTLAETRTHLERPGRAQEICSQAMEAYDELDETHVLRIMLARQHALAQARAGQLADARQSLEALLEQVQPTRHPLLLTRLYEAATELALAAKDGEAAVRHLAGMQAAVEPTRNPALLALYHSTAKNVSASGLTAASEIEADEDDDVLTQADNPMEAQLQRVLEGLEPHEWPPKLLRLLLVRANASAGYLFLWEDDEPQLVAATLPDDPPPALWQRIRTRLEEDTDDGQTPHTASAFESDAPSGLPYKLLVLPALRAGAPPQGVVALLVEGASPTVLPAAFLRAVSAQLAQAS